MSLYGALFKNDVGGTLISDENPTYMEVSTSPYSHTESGSDSQLTNVSDDRAWNSPADFWTLWNQTKTRTFLFDTPLVSESEGLPIVAVNFNDIPGGCESSWEWNTNGPFLDHYGLFDVPNCPIAYTRRYYSTNGITILSIQCVYRDDTRATWSVTYASNTRLNRIRAFIPMAKRHIDNTQTHGIEVSDCSGETLFSTRVKWPFTGGILRPKQFVIGNFGTPLESNDIRWAKPRYASFADGLLSSDWVILSLNGYGAAVSTVAVSELHLEENLYGGDLYKRINYAGAVGYYRVGVVRCGTSLMLAPLFTTISSYGGVSTESSSIGGVLMGSPEASAAINADVSAPNYTMDEASNTAIIING